MVNSLSRTQELDQFKTQINLCEYAATRGFELDRKKSSRRCAVMRHHNGDKLVISRGTNQHWVYFNVHDDRDQGTIVDFIQVRDRCSLGELRRQLRAWRASEPFAAFESPRKMPHLVPCQYDASQVLKNWMKAQPIDGGHPYLEKERQIPASILGEACFADQIRIDRRGNALFPHYRDGSLCGFEVKNRGFTGFSPGGMKSIWSSTCEASPQEFVIAENAIDALSYAALHGLANRRFNSLSGQPSALQIDLLKEIVSNGKDIQRVILAFDQDEGGHKLAQRIEESLASTLPSTANMQRHFPSVAGQDWNDVLRQRSHRFNQVAAVSPTLSK